MKEKKIGMSYSRRDVDDSVNALFSRLCDLRLVLKNLEEAATKESFIIWLNKCILIDKRSTFLYLKKNRNKFTKEFIDLAQLEFAEDLYEN